jgi:hypothetical protein
MAQHVADARDHGIDLVRDRLGGRAAHGLQHLGDAEGAHKRRQEPDAARKIRASEGEALVIVVRLLADGGDEEAEEPRHVALDRVAARKRARDHDAEHRDPEELEALEAQGDVAQHWRQRRDAQDAEERSKPGTARRDAHGAAGKPLLGEREAVERRAGRSRRAGNVEQDRRSAAAVDRAHIDADEHEDGLLVRHREGERRHQRHAHGGGEARQRSDDDAKECCP